MYIYHQGITISNWQIMDVHSLESCSVAETQQELEIRGPKLIIRNRNKTLSQTTCFIFQTISPNAVNSRV